jgi:PleD family two-component response regulator
MSERGWPVTFSIGVASCERPPVDLNGLLGEADKLMYEAKNGGRNRILQRAL